MHAEERGMHGQLRGLAHRADRATGAAKPRLLVTSFASGEAELLASFDLAAAALRLPTLALALDGAAAGVAWGGSAALVDASALGASPLERKWRAIAALLEEGVRPSEAINRLSARLSVDCEPAPT